VEPLLDALTRYRHVIAPGLGAAVVVTAVFGLDTGPTFAILLGALVWAGAALMLVPSRPFARLLKRQGIGYDPQMLAGELEQAQGRIRAIRKVKDRLDAPVIGASLDRIASSAAAIIADLQRNPSDYRRMRKALMHYLAHAEIIAERFAYMHSLGAVRPETVRRTEHTLADLEKVFIEYNRRMFEDEEADMDARIALLEQEIRTEGIEGVGEDRPNGPWGR
jgi:hypothetical protein